MLGDVSMYCLKSSSCVVQCEVSARQGGLCVSLAAVHLGIHLPWYWGHCLHKPSFQVKREEGGEEERGAKK